MHIFPTENEKIITGLIIAFLLGLGIGLATVFEHINIKDIFYTLFTVFEQQSIKDIIPVLGTLVAAFLGAWTAFLLESRSRKREKREQSLESANKLLYVLYERLNTIKLFQYDFVNPTRDDPSQMISMEPVLDFRTPESELDAQDISFLFQTKYKHLMLTLHVANEQFYETVKAIRHRSDLHLNILQPLLEQAGFRLGNEISSLDIENAVGERNFHMLKQSTEVVVYNVDKFIERGVELKENLIVAFSDVFSEKELFNYILQDEPFKNPYE